MLCLFPCNEDLEEIKKILYLLYLISEPLLQIVFRETDIKYRWDLFDQPFLPDTEVGAADDTFAHAVPNDKTNLAIPGYVASLNLSIVFLLICIAQGISLVLII